MNLPSLVRALLVRLLPEDERDAAIGDLDEELRTRVLPRRGRAGAALWYLREAGSLLASYLWDRIRGAPAPDRASRPDEGGMTMETMRDAMHATRVIRREPLVSLVVILTLALGIGANAAIFSVVNAALLRELPYPRAERLVRIFNGFEGSDGTFALSPLDWRDVESRPDLVEAVGVYGETSYHLTIDSREARRLEVARTSPGLLDLLGFRAEVGRGFRPEEAEPGRHRSVILSHRIWTSAFGADPGIVGRTITLDEESYEVVGVAPPDFRVPLQADVWVPLALEPGVWYVPDRRGWEFLYAYGHLSEGVTPEVAARGLTARLAETAPDRVADNGQHLLVRDLREHMVGDTGRALTLLLAAVGFVLLIACANLANLLLARAEARSREFAIRRALGAGTASVARLVFLETLALAAAGGLTGLALARGILGLLARLEVEALAPFGRISVDPGVLAFTAAVTTVTALLFGLGPALRASGADSQGVLREGGSRSGGSRRGGRLRSGLVALQVALALVLLVGLGDSLRSFRRLTATDPGFRPEGVLAVSLELPPSGLERVERAELYRGLLDRVGTLPDVESAGLVNFLPLDGRRWSASFHLVDPPPSMEGVDLGGNMRAASPDYFRTMGIRLLEGRTFTEADGGGAPVAVVDERAAREAWPGASP
ncbi:MAG: FtsX-like permease family protein, partial [Gemmatimonadetes bacterium]|nr:FtsX-like permease family protein [Gemmatimonadota bacterium]NIR81292.1 FtsX-like permease family protein [Gemmatimonadota bacterium]NIT90127.1 FtsX-like permease family protein [Gemmatimonadota bacterium]NIU33954.1 FtsX-like permease family protein [Gemmatimonadota bacterium]NIU38133.1 FtsX-like permease family protein [Gemmatimonadota bacterium]